MKQFVYACEKCLKYYTFYEEDSDFSCPKCRKLLTYLRTEEKDSTTNKITNRYQETERKRKNPGAPVVTVECPYCHSTNTRKISGFAKLGTLSWGATPKEWHCNRCDSDF